LLVLAIAGAPLLVDLEISDLDLRGDVAQRIPADAVVLVLERVELVVPHLVGSDLIHREERPWISEVKGRGLLLQNLWTGHVASDEVIEVGHEIRTMRGEQHSDAQVDQNSEHLE